MQVVILAAGRGKRFHEMTDKTPKPMLSLLGKPVLEYKLENLPSEIDEVIFVVNYLYEIVKNHFGNEFGGRKIKYAFQKELNGTGGAIHSARNLLKEKFLVLMGDDLYSKEDLEKLVQNNWAVLAKEVSNSSSGAALLTDENGSLVDIIESENFEGNSKLVNTGAYVLQKDFFDFPLVSISETEFGLPQTLVSLPFKNEIKVEKATFWQPINNKEEFLKAEEALKVD